VKKETQTKESNKRHTEKERKQERSKWREGNEAGHRGSSASVKNQRQEREREGNKEKKEGTNATMNEWMIGWIVQ